MKHKVIISKKNGTFPIKGLNELLGGRVYNHRTKKYHNPVKSDNDKVCLMAIRKCIPKVKIDCPVKCTYWIYAQDKKHDRANLCAAVSKSFADSLIHAGVIKNDTWDLYLDETFHTGIDRANPRIEVVIEEMGDGYKNTRHEQN